MCVFLLGQSKREESRRAEDVVVKIKEVTFGEILRNYLPQLGRECLYDDPQYG